MITGVQSIFNTTATAENLGPLADNVLWEGDILTVSLIAYHGTGNHALQIAHRPDISFKTGDDIHPVIGIPALVSLSGAFKNPELARTDIEHQVRRYAELSTTAKDHKDTLARKAVEKFDEYYDLMNDIVGSGNVISPEDKISPPQKAMFFTSLSKVPETLKRAINQDGVKIIIDDSPFLKGTIPPVDERIEGAYIDGNLFLTDPYSAAVITQEMLHYVDKKLQFSETEQFTSSIDPLTKQPDLLYAIGYCLNKQYKADSRTYDIDDNQAMAHEYLSDMYIIKHGLLDSERMDYYSAVIAETDTRNPQRFSRIQALESFYNKLVRGKDLSEIEQYFNKDKLPGVQLATPTQSPGLEFATHLHRISQQTMDQIFENKNNPQALLETLYPQDMIKQLNEFETQMERKYPSPSPISEAPEPFIPRMRQAGGFLH
ncbi:MAG: hypothetical protein ACLFP8_03245 [Alphaproteobacteria bacterium]